MRSLIVLLVVLLQLGGCESSSSPPPPPSSPLPAPGHRLDLNRATIKELEALPGIGPVKARSIMASRNARGGRFNSLDELIAIDGIGEKTVDAIRPYVEVGP